MKHAWNWLLKLVLHQYILNCFNSLSINDDYSYSYIATAMAKASWIQSGPIYYYMDTELGSYQIISAILLFKSTAGIFKDN